MNRSFITVLMVYAVLTSFMVSKEAQAADNQLTKTGTVVVTGTRTEHLIEEVPQTMQVITQEEIQRSGAASVKDVLANSANISVDGQKGGINIRGMGFDRTVLLINGRRVSTAENTKDAHSFYINSINVNNIERIEVIRGQAGAMYGSNAIGGVVNIITKSSKEKSATVGLVAGNDSVRNYYTFDTGNMNGFDAIFTTSLTKLYSGIKEDRYIAGTDQKSGGWTKSSDGYDVAFNLDTGYKFNDDHELRLIAEWAQQDYTAQSKSSATASTSTSYTDRIRYGSGLVYNGSTENHMFNMSANYSEMQIGKFSSGVQYYTDKFSTTVFNANDSWSLADWNTFTFGAEYSYSTTNQRTAVRGDSLAYWSFFAQEELAFFDDTLFFVLQGRYDHYDADFGGAFTPNIGVTWEFIEDHRLKANWGMGFMAPTLAQLYGTETTGNGTVYGSSDLEPEESSNFEVRYEGAIGNFSGSLGYYYSDIKDYLSSEETFDYATYEPLTSTGRSYVRKNIGKVRNQGIEFDFSYQMHEFFKLRGGYVYSDAQDITAGTQLTYSSVDTYTAGIEFFHPEWGVSANLWGNYNKDFKSDSSTVYDYYNVNFSASKAWGEKDQYKVNLALYNFLQTKNDADNVTSLNPFEVRVGFEMTF